MNTTKQIDKLRKSDLFLNAFAWIFAAAFLWPFLHLLAKTYEGIETLILPALIQIPTFLLFHAIGLVKIYSDNPTSKKIGKRALGIVWLSIVTFWALIFIAAGISMIFEKG